MSDTPIHIEPDHTPILGFDLPHVSPLSDDGSIENIQALFMEDLGDDAAKELEMNDPEAYVWLLIDRAQQTLDDDEFSLQERFNAFEADNRTVKPRFGSVRTDKPERKPIVNLIDPNTRRGRLVLKHIFGYRPNNRQSALPLGYRMTEREVKRWNS